MMHRVYFSSTLRHRKKWLKFCEDNPRIHGFSRWIYSEDCDTATDENTDPSEACKFWMMDEQDVRDADCVLVYAEPGDRLRGALVEAGMALAYGVKVIVCGDHPDFGTWRYHKGVINVKSLEAALGMIAYHKPAYEKAKTQGKF